MADFKPQWATGWSGWVYSWWGGGGKPEDVKAKDIQNEKGYHVDQVSWIKFMEFIKSEDQLMRVDIHVLQEICRSLRLCDMENAEDKQSIIRKLLQYFQQIEQSLRSNPGMVPQYLGTVYCINPLLFCENNIPQNLKTPEDAKSKSNDSLTEIPGQVSVVKSYIRDFIEECRNPKNCIKSKMPIYLKSTLPNVNPFEFTEIKFEDKTLLLNVSEILMKSTDQRIYDAISACLRYYMDTSRICGLLYAAALVSFTLHNIVKVKTISRWSADPQHKEYYLKVYPIKCVNCLQWMFFALIISLNAIIKSSTVSGIRRYDIQYSPSGWDLYLSTFNKTYPSQLTANCVFSTLLEAYKAQIMGVAVDKIEVKMQTPRTEQNITWRTLKGIGPEEFGTHMFSKINDESYGEASSETSVYVMCSNETINFKNNKLYIAKLNIYIVISFFKNIIRYNFEKKRMTRVEAEDHLARIGEFVYKLRLLLESELPPEAEKISPDVIAQEFKEDTRRDARYFDNPDKEEQNMDENFVRDLNKQQILNHPMSDEAFVRKWIKIFGKPNTYLAKCQTSSTFMRLFYEYILLREKYKNIEPFLRTALPNTYVITNQSKEFRFLWTDKDNHQRKYRMLFLLTVLYFEKYKDVNLDPPITYQIVRGLLESYMTQIKNVCDTFTEQPPMDNIPGVTQTKAFKDLAHTNLSRIAQQWQKMIDNAASGSSSVHFSNEKLVPLDELKVVLIWIQRMLETCF